MIIFLNFAPYEFGGGMEKLITDLSRLVRASEDTTLISVSNNIGNNYSKLVLKRKFDHRFVLNKGDYTRKFDLDYKHFLPFTKEWKDVCESFRASRLVYFKYELLELLIAVYFGGFSIFRKMVAGIHSPFVYYTPITFLERIHNFVYTSWLSRALLNNMHKVHATTLRDKQFLEKRLRLRDVLLIPNGVKMNDPAIFAVSNTSKLNILFAGELSMRKGIDMLIEVVRRAPETYQFTIIGNGPMKSEVMKLADIHKNCTYRGYVSITEKDRLYKEADVLFLPARAEGFPLVILEAMSHGLMIVDSQNIHLDLPPDIEYTNKTNKAEEYLHIFSRIHSLKQKSTYLQIKKYIARYCKDNLSEEVVFSDLSKHVFELSKPK